jgi:hypothetical protein
MPGHVAIGETLCGMLVGALLQTGKIASMVCLECGYNINSNYVWNAHTNHKQVPRIPTVYIP